METKEREILTTQEIIHRYDSLKKQLTKLRGQMGEEDVTSSSFRYFSEQAEDIQSQISDLLFTRWIKVLPGDLGKKQEIKLEEMLKDIEKL